ncbi:hypothetical protein HGM15179_007307 [Zosterops borbonicus]|uniref:Uncharacterized protein n=1 Tax=Zosterops borbonicus TaxID=364589 RepID=A0A8K1GJ24_9PASS|nr:hypothetical protein HGM15179_007307 [Zosterops borbonicus]
MPKQRLVTSAIPQESVLGLSVLFNVFISSIDSGIGSTLGELADNREQSAAIDISEGWDGMGWSGMGWDGMGWGAIQRNLDKLEKWLHVNLMSSAHGPAEPLVSILGMKRLGEALQRKTWGYWWMKC